jgi:hypothetical protein
MANSSSNDRVTAYCKLRLPPPLGADAYRPLSDVLVRLADTRSPLQHSVVGRSWRNSEAESL